ncbi:hypothetical protein TWF281_010872 [Arthrobotrys megalospora]
MRYRTVVGKLATPRQYTSTSIRQRYAATTISESSMKETQAVILTIVAEFKRADIRITKAGVHYMEIAYSSGLSSKNPINSLALWKMVEEEERSNIAVTRWSSTLKDYYLWEWLEHMLKTGIIEAEDVDNLPDPVKLKDAKAGAVGLQKGM